MNLELYKKTLKDKLKGKFTEEEDRYNTTIISFIMEEAIDSFKNEVGLAVKESSYLKGSDVCSIIDKL